MTNEEIMSILLYCDLLDKSDGQVNSNDRMTNTCKWKKLFESLCSGVTKLYYTFHYKTRYNNVEPVLYHTFVNDNDSICNESGLHSIALFESAKNINKYNNNNNNSSNLCLLQIRDCQNHLTDGGLIAANISHFFLNPANGNAAPGNNKHSYSYSLNSINGLMGLKTTQWIVLPVKFGNFKNGVVSEYVSAKMKHIMLDLDELSYNCYSLCSRNTTHKNKQRNKETKMHLRSANAITHK